MSEEGWSEAEGGHKRAQKNFGENGPASRLEAHGAADERRLVVLVVLIRSGVSRERRWAIIWRGGQWGALDEREALGGAGGW